MPLKRAKAWALAVLIAALAGAGTAWFYHVSPEGYGDFDQIWLAARALRQGQEPYAEVAKLFPYPLYYPLPAVLCGLPFTLLPLGVARVAFAALGAGAFGAAILIKRPMAWPWLISFPFLYGVERAQWTPLLVAATLTPLSGIAACKPSIGLALFGYRPARATILGGAALLAVSFLVRPDWVEHWRAALVNAPHLVPPARRPFGFLLLLALLEWRSPEARLVGLLACVPQTLTLYELLPFALVAPTWQVSAGLVLLTNVLYLGIVYVLQPSTQLQLADFTASIWLPTLVMGYLPALVVVLWPRFRAWRKGEHLGAPA
jgi:hypothetical protein